MSRSWIGLIVLFIAVAALGTFVYFRPHTQQQEYRLSGLKPGDAQRLRIERPGQPAIELARKSADWRLTAPFRARAETVQVQRVLDILEAKAATRFAATALARFELDRPQAQVTINDQQFAYGTVSPVTGELYVRTGDWVYPLPVRYLASLPPQGIALVSRQMFAPTEIPVRFEFPRFVVSQKDGRWNVTAGSSDLSQDDINRWVDNWRQASALRVEPFDAPVPAKHITVELNDGRRVPIGIEENDSELAFTRFDEHLRYYLFPKVARLMLAPPQGEPLTKSNLENSVRSKR